MEQEQNNTLAFLDVQVTREKDGSIDLPHNSLQANAHRLIPTQDILPPPTLQVSSQQHPPPPSYNTCDPSPSQLRVFSQANIKVYHTAPHKIQAQLQTHKDKQDLNTMAGGYSIPCKCGNVYIGEKRRELKTKIKEHQAHGRKGEIDKSAIIKHSHEQDHRIHWDQARIIAAVTHWHPRRIREAIKIY
ncbi:uncharacterized protein LOC119743341 [Patiria miniata]|uniref:Uncharacterized protein n=1 Tax=Patiria miniata TaxID=46514 RepID=A0A914BIE2_PATMI|nr:uncharacterized protein LOC119743341 [Patiria miniata]